MGVLLLNHTGLAGADGVENPVGIEVGMDSSDLEDEKDLKRKLIRRRRYGGIVHDGSLTDTSTLFLECQVPEGSMPGGSP